MANRIKKIAFIAAITVLSCTIATPVFSAPNNTQKDKVIKTHISNHDNHKELFKKLYIEKNDVLSVSDCVSIAFNNSPVIRKYKYNLDLVKSNVGIAKAEYFPVIGAGVGFWNENHSNSKDFDNHTRIFPEVAVTVNQLVYNFGKTTANIKMEEFYKIGAEYEFIDSLCETLFDVKEKYYALLLAQSRMTVEKKNYELNEQFLDMAEKLATKNSAREADITSARMNYNISRVRYLQAKNDFDNAKIDLNNAMYIEEPENYTVLNTETYTYTDEFIDSDRAIEFRPENLPFNEKDAVQIAYKSSPDLKVLIATFKAMEQSLNYVKRMYLPDLTANAGYGHTNGNLYSHDNSFQVGVSLNTSINLMDLRHRIKGADAQLNIADNEIVLFKKDLHFRVQRALTNLHKTELEFPICQVAASNAYSHLLIVIDEYKKGQADYVALQNARVAYQNAMNNYINALYAYNIALINVEKAMHCHIIDIHHKSEHAILYHGDELIEHITKWMNCDEKEKRKYIRKEYKL